MFINPFIQTWNDDRYYCTLHVVASLTEVDSESRSQACEKAKTSMPVISQSFHLIWMECGILLRCFGVMNLVLILSHLFNIQGREPY